MAVANRLILVFLLLAGCHAPSKPGLKIATAGDPQTFDPRMARELYSVNQAHLLYQGLFRKTPSGETVPALAESYEMFNEGRSFRFYLRDCCWSNGEPLLAEDVVRSWREVEENPRAPFGYQLQILEHYYAESDRILRVDLKYPLANFLELLATNSFFPYKEAYSGPFVLEEWIPHRHLILAKNPRYWDAEHIAVERVIFEKINDTVAVELFRHGELDWVGSPLGSLPLYEEEFRATPCLATRFVRLNVEKIPLAARRALSGSVSREQLASLIAKRGERAAYGFLPSLFELELGPQEVEKVELDALTLLYIQSDTNHLIAQYLEQQWKKELGLKLHLQPCNPQVFYDLLREKEYEMALGTWYACSWDPLNFLEFLKQENETGWTDPRFASLLDAVALETDGAHRRALLKEAESLLQEEVPVISLYHPSFVHLAKPECDYIKINPLGLLDFHL